MGKCSNSYRAGGNTNICNTNLWITNLNNCLCSRGNFMNASCSSSDANKSRSNRCDYTTYSNECSNADTTVSSCIKKAQKTEYAISILKVDDS